MGATCTPQVYKCYQLSPSYKKKIQHNGVTIMESQPYFKATYL